MIKHSPKERVDKELDISGRRWLTTMRGSWHRWACIRWMKGSIPECNLGKCYCRIEYMQNWYFDSEVVGLPKFVMTKSIFLTVYLSNQTKLCSFHSAEWWSWLQRWESAPKSTDQEKERILGFDFRLLPLESMMTSRKSNLRMIQESNFPRWGSSLASKKCIGLFWWPICIGD